MGKIKSKLIRRTAKKFIEEGIGFTEDFKDNKKILSDTMPSKKIRNQMAGLLVTIKKQERVNKPKIIQEK